MTDKVIEAFEEWFREKFQPQPDYVNEAALQKDLQKQLDSWVRKAFPGMAGKRQASARVPRAFRLPVSA